MRRWNEIKNEREWRAYRRRLVERAECHARTVHHIAPIIADEVREVADEIWVMSLVASVRIGNEWFSFRYDRHHEPRRVEVRAGSWSGDVLGTFTNDNTAGEVRDLLRRIAPARRAA